jgi:hypothetical protein
MAAQVTVNSLIGELDDAKALAERLELPGVVVQAIMGKAKITGNIIERKETGQPGDFAALDNSEQIIDLVRKEMGDTLANALQAALTKAALEPTHDGTEAVN